MRESGFRCGRAAVAAVCAVLLGGAVVPSSSLASTTFGADLSATPNHNVACSASCTVINTALPAGAPLLISPVTGTIIRWRIKTGPGSNGTVTFRVIAPAVGGKFTGAGTGDTETTPTIANAIVTATFGTRLPVRAGDYVGVDSSATNVLAAFASSQTGAIAAFFARLADGGSPASPVAASGGVELLVNSDVASLPTSAVAVPGCNNNGQLAATVTSDPDPAVAPKAIHFRMDGGSEQVMATSGKPGSATISVPRGSHTLEYWGEDTVGGLESPHHSASVVVGCPPTPPSLTRVSQSHRRWRLGRKLARFAAARKPPVGTTFRFTLNEAATVRFAFAQLLPGRKVNGKCVAQTARNRTHKACTRSAPRGALSFSAGAGLHRLFFQGRLTRTRKLKPGTYRLTITATNAAGQRTARTLRTFTILPG